MAHLKKKKKYIFKMEHLFKREAKEKKRFIVKIRLVKVKNLQNKKAR